MPVIAVQSRGLSRQYLRSYSTGSNEQENTTHFGFKDVPKSEKEHLGKKREENRFK